MKKMVVTIIVMLMVFSVLFVIGEKLGYTSEASIRNIIEKVHASSGHQVMAAGVIIGLLVVDILLPIPSSVVMTLSGSLLGFWLGGAVSFAGALLAACIGFFGCRWGGRKFFVRMVGSQDIEKIKTWFEDYGVVAIIISRPVPMLTEILSCLCGLSRVKPSTFLLAAVLGTLPICFVYSWFGDLGGHGLMPAVWISIAIPAMGWAFTHWVKKRRAGKVSKD